MIAQPLFFLSFDGKLLTEPEAYQSSYFFKKLLPKLGPVEESKPLEQIDQLEQLNKTERREYYILRDQPFLEKDLINLKSFSIVILPTIIGKKEAPTLVASSEQFLSRVYRQQLIEVKEIAGEILLLYNFLA